MTWITIAVAEPGFLGSDVCDGCLIVMRPAKPGPLWFKENRACLSAPTFLSQHVKGAKTCPVVEGSEQANLWKPRAEDQAALMSGVLPALPPSPRFSVDETTSYIKQTNKQTASLTRPKHPLFFQKVLAQWVKTYGSRSCLHFTRGELTEKWCGWALKTSPGIWPVGKHWESQLAGTPGWKGLDGCCCLARAKEDQAEVPPHRAWQSGELRWSRNRLEGPCVALWLGSQPMMGYGGKW